MADPETPLEMANGQIKGTLSPDGSSIYINPKSLTNGTVVDEPESFASSASSSPALAHSSDDDYDTMKADPDAIVPGARGGGIEFKSKTIDNSSVFARRVNGGTEQKQANGKENKRPGLSTRRLSIPVVLKKTEERGHYIITTEDQEFREFLKTAAVAHPPSDSKKQRKRFSELVFTRQFTTFDRQNPRGAGSPFYGFFTLFWLAAGILILRIAASNYRNFGSVLGRNEIFSLMMHRDVLVLGFTDLVMCSSTVFCMFLQKLIVRGWIDWNRSGWAIQMLWQAFYVGAVIEWTMFREWPWTHTIFIVLHSLVMLMKQHSYAFYNGYLSSLYKRRKVLQKKLDELSAMEPVTSPTTTFAFQDLGNSGLKHRTQSPEYNRIHSEVTEVVKAVEQGAQLDLDQLRSIRRLISAEIESIEKDLSAKCSPEKVKTSAYPKNLTLYNFTDYIFLPTLVYELEYPRLEKRNWAYIAEKTTATFGVIFCMIVVSQAYIYPVVLHTLEMKDQGWTTWERLVEFPWILGDLIFPFMFEYLMTWYVIWECILNVFAEVTLFADRGFYGDWWNTVSWDQFARDWNRPVHVFLLRHVYHSSISSYKVSRGIATLITFLLSAFIHELLMWVIFKKLRGYLLLLQMSQLPLVMLFQTKWLKGKQTLGNIVFWIGIFTGPSLMCTLYLVL